MTYELAKKLKDAGFPQELCALKATQGGDSLIGFPTLSELIEACGKAFQALELTSGIHSFRNEETLSWEARGYQNGKLRQIGAFTPEEAVARLYLALHPKS